MPLLPLNYLRLSPNFNVEYNASNHCLTVLSISELTVDNISYA